MLNVSEFLPDYERMFREAEVLGQDGFWTGEPFTGIPWMEAILGCPIRAGRESFTSRPWLNSPAEALEKVRLDPQESLVGEISRIHRRPWCKQSRGRYPVGMPIMRGPTDMLGALLGQQEMVMALMMTDPQVMHRLIERVTRVFLAVIEAQRRLIPPFYGGTGPGVLPCLGARARPSGSRTTCRAILSPRLYRQFFLDSARMILAGARPHRRPPAPELLFHPGRAAHPRRT